MKRHFLFNTILNAFLTGWGVLISIFLTPFLIRNLGKEAYGVWVLVLSFSVASGYLALLDLGLSSSVVKLVAEYYARRETEMLNQIISVGLYVFSLCGLLAAVGVAIFAQLFLTRVFNIPSHLVDTTRLLMYLLALQVLFEFPGLIFKGILNGLQSFHLLRGVEIFRLGAYAVLVIALLSRGYSLVALGVIALLIAVSRALVLGIFTWRFVPGLRLVKFPNKQTFRRISGFSSQIFLIRINAIIYMQMDKAIIGILLVSTLLTDYDIAFKIQALVSVSLTWTNSLIVPAASQLEVLEDKFRLQELFLKGTKYTLSICLPLATAVFVMTESIIQVWIGPDFVYNAGITRLFVSYLFFNPLVAVGFNIMIGMERISPIWRIQIAATMVNLITSILLVLWTGSVAGVIWGTFAGNLIGLIPYLRHFLASLDISWSRFWREVLRPTYPIVTMFGFLLYIGYRLTMPDDFWGLAGLGLFAMIVYGLMFMTFGMSKEERRMLLNAVVVRPTL